jgi:GH43 family beta-xylosidase
MTPRLHRLIPTLALLGLASGWPHATRAADAGDTWTNPLVLQRADPHVLRHTDGFYYLVATVPEYDRIELRRASTLAGLSIAQPETLWRRPASGPMSGVVWAPEIHFIDGRWFIYFSGGEAGGPWHSVRLYVLENAAADPFADEWKEKGKISTQWDTFTLDPTTFEHRGVRYLVWTQVEPDRQGSNIYLARMDSPTSIVGEPTLLSRPEFLWEQRVYWVNEAPAVLIRHEKVFITYSASATDSNYCMGLLTAAADADLLDPRSWHKSPEPVFTSSTANSQFGPGHNSFTTTPDGRTDILVYHARNYREIPGEALSNPDRHTRAQVLSWTNDNHPVFGEPAADGPCSAPSTRRPASFEHLSP